MTVVVRPRALRRALLVASCVVLAACTVSRQNSQVVVRIDGERAVRDATRSLYVRVFGGPRGADLTDESLQSLERVIQVDPDQGWPRRIALAPLNREWQRLYRIEVRAYRLRITGGEPAPDDVPLAVARALSGYVEGKTLVLDLTLYDACIDRPPCEENETCNQLGQCVPAEIDEDDLPVLDEDAGATTSDAGSMPLDGGMDGAAIDGASIDAARGGDAGSDSGQTCQCDDGLTCTDDYCDGMGVCQHVLRDSMCNDGNPCTDDACSGMPSDGPSGCSNAPNSAGCDDGAFCNGFDRCSAGSCTGGTPPCGMLTCDETNDVCMGCSASAPCPMPELGSWSTCAFGDPCTTTGVQTRPRRSYTCVAGACVPSDTLDSQACTRGSTDGDVCAAPMFGPFLCLNDYSSTCDQTATSVRTRTDYVCAGGVCDAVPSSETGSCSRNTGGMSCDDGNPCTNTSSCSNEMCVGSGTCTGDAGPRCFVDGDCFDGFSCTADVCMSNGQCLNPRIDMSCFQGPSCVRSYCDPQNGAPITGCRDDYSLCDAGLSECEQDFDCDDGDPCTTDYCFRGAFPFTCEAYPDGSCDAGTDAGRDAGVGGGRDAGRADAGRDAGFGGPDAFFGGPDAGRDAGFGGPPDAFFGGPDSTFFSPDSGFAMTFMDALPAPP